MHDKTSLAIYLHVSDGKVPLEDWKVIFALPNHTILCHRIGKWKRCRTTPEGELKGQLTARQHTEDARIYKTEKKNKIIIFELLFTGT